MVAGAPRVGEVHAMKVIQFFFSYLVGPMTMRMPENGQWQGGSLI